jgi:hypothetical protein
MSGTSPVHGSSWWVGGMCSKVKVSNERQHLSKSEEEGNLIGRVFNIYLINYGKKKRFFAEHNFFNI